MLALLLLLMNPSWDASAGFVNRPFWVQVLAYDNVKYYGWIEVVPSEGGVFVASSAPRTGSIVCNPFYTANGELVAVGSQVIGNPQGSYILIQRAEYDSVLDWTYIASGGSAFVSDECIDIEFDSQSKDQCDYPILNRYVRTLIYNCGVLQFPLPAWELVGQVGCCACPSGSGTLTSCCPPQASTYFCICFPFASCTTAGCPQCQNPSNGITLVRNGGLCEWDNVNNPIGTLGGPIKCGTRSYQLFFTGCDSDLCGDNLLTLNILQYDSGLFTGQATYQVVLGQWNCDSTVILKLLSDTMTSVDDLGVKFSPTLTLLPEAGPCCASGTGTEPSGSGTGPPFLCVERIVSGSGGGGTEVCSSCPSALLSTTVTAVITSGGACNGTYTLTYGFNSILGWVTQQGIGTCVPATGFAFNMSVLCNSPGIFGLGFAAAPGAVLSTSVNCGPPTLSILFTNVDMTSCGGTNNATVTVTGTSGGSGGTGTGSGGGSVSYYCISINQVTGGNAVVGGVVEWGGGLTGTVISTGWADGTCGGNCPPTSGTGTGTQIHGVCCFPLPDILHITFGGSLAPLGSVILTSTNAGSGSGPWKANVISACGNGPIVVACNSSTTGTWTLEGHLTSPPTDPGSPDCIIAFGAYADTINCPNLLVKFCAIVGGGPCVYGNGTIGYKGDCAPSFCFGNMTATLTL